MTVELGSMGEELVRLSVVDSVAVLVIDHPPVNASSGAVRRALMDGLTTAEANPDVRALVLIGAGGTFVAGSDVSEFDGPIPEPTLPAVITALMSSRLPVVAALDGHALGGGLELALGCDVRIATERAVVGLPEVSLGLVPGAGGTQRLPRLTGISAALDIIGTSRRLSAVQAHEVGIVADVVAVGRLLDEALRRAHHCAGKLPVDDLEVPHEPDDQITTATDRLAGRRALSSAEPVARQLVLDSATEPIQTMLARERVAFEETRASDEAQALRYLFFAERDASRLARSTQRAPARVDTVGVVGAGTMGAAIARAFGSAGFSVLIFDQSTEVAERSARSGSGMGVADRLEGLEEVDLVIETVPEDLPLKQQVLQDLASVVGPRCLIATNTSYLDLNALAAEVPHPERVLGMHFFNPADRMPLVEVVRGAATSTDTLAAARTVVKTLGKQFVCVGVGEGFVGNRIYSAYRAQVERLLQDGAKVSQVDEALRTFGFAMGPFAVADMSGLDIAWAMRKRLASTRSPDDRYVDIADRLCERRRFGVKSGAGYYRYPDGPRSRKLDPMVDLIVAESASAAGIRPRAVDDEEIVMTAVLAMVNEASHVLADGVAREASDIDVVMTLGYGFPRRSGGPLFWAAQQPSEAIDIGLERLRRSAGGGFAPGPVAALLDDIRRAGPGVSHART